MGGASPVPVLVKPVCPHKSSMVRLHVHILVTLTISSPNSSKRATISSPRHHNFCLYGGVPAGPDGGCGPRCLNKTGAPHQEIRCHKIFFSCNCPTSAIIRPLSRACFYGDFFFMSLLVVVLSPEQM